VRPLGPTDWDTSVLVRPLVVRADPSGLSGPEAETVAAGLAALADGAHDDASAAAAVLGTAGVVAVRGLDSLCEVRETLDGWEFVCSEAPTADPGDLAAAAAVRAVRLAEARRRGADR